MKYPKWYPLWTSPDEEMEEAFHRSSLILFRMQRNRAVVVASRCPHLPHLPVGSGFLDRLEIPADVCMELCRHSGDTRPIFLRTRVGVGMIDRTYALETGLFLYVHIHSRPRHLMAQINGGVLGDPTAGRFALSPEIRDFGEHPGLCRERDYAILADVWADAEARRRGLLRLMGKDTLYRGHLEDTILSLAGYAGCRVTFDEKVGAVLPSHDGMQAQEPVTRMRCHRPRVCEGLLLYLLLEAQRYALDREARVRISTVNGTDGAYLSLSVGYTARSMAAFEKDRPVLERIHQYLQIVAEANGMGVSVQTAYPIGKRKKYCDHPEICLTVDWLYNPALLETTDLKARGQAPKGCRGALERRALGFSRPQPVRKQK